MLIILCAVSIFTIGRCRDDLSFSTKTVHVGEDVTLRCSRSFTNMDSGTLFWMRAVAGNLPEVLGGTYTFDNARVDITSRFTAKQEKGTYVLQITKTKLSDTGFYYCEKHAELTKTFVNITFLRVEGPEVDITAIIHVPPSDAVHPGDLVTLECSVLFNPEKKTCSGGHSVYWFRGRSNESHPSVIYAHENGGDQCERSPGGSQKCVNNLSWNVSSADAGTYYCALATCGEMIFGNGLELDIKAGNMWLFGDCQKPTAVMLLLSAALALSLIVIALLIYTIKKNKYDCFNASSADIQTNATGDRQSQKTDQDSVVYSTALFTRKAGPNLRSAAKAVEGQSVYSDVRVLG